jgi:hypothetical protein
LDWFFVADGGEVEVEEGVLGIVFSLRSIHWVGSSLCCFGFWDWRPFVGSGRFVILRSMCQ